MWTKSNYGIGKKIVISRFLISTILDVYFNDNSEYLIRLDNGLSYIFNTFPVVNLSSNFATDIDGDYDYLFNSQSNEAVFYSASTTYYAIPINIKSRKITWYFCKSKSFEGLTKLINNIELGKGQFVFDIDGKLINKSSQFYINDTSDFCFYKTIPSNSLDKIIYYLDAVGDIKVKSIYSPLTEVRVDTNDVDFNYSSSISISSEFTGNYGSRFVGYLYFYVDGDLYEKNVDIKKDAESDDWFLINKSKKYYGAEPLRDSVLNYSTKTNPIEIIKVEYTTDKINSFEDSVSIPNSKEVSSVWD